MAGAKQKNRTPREAPHRIPPTPPAELAPALKGHPAPSTAPADLGSRVALTVWFLAFAFLASFALWDLITALLFR